jgi:zinc/manganese transport system substrate-binding protein
LTSETDEQRLRKKGKISMKKLGLFFFLTFCTVMPVAMFSGFVQAAPISVVAAESTYGVIAEAIGGDLVKVDSIIKNPNVDPHLFEADPTVARRVAGAQVVVMNGIGYDDWMPKLLAANPTGQRQVVVVAEIAPFLIMADKNPHIFYDPRVGLLTASRLAELFARLDPAHAAQFRANLEQFANSLLQVYSTAQQVMTAHPSLTVTATEPVVGYMTRLLGYRSINEHFQFDVMNNSEPSPKEVAGYEDSLRRHRAAVLFYNQQVTDPLTKRIQGIAKSSGVPVVGVDEFVPPQTSYGRWLVETLQRLDKALPAPGGVSAK